MYASANQSYPFSNYSGSVELKLFSSLFCYALLSICVQKLAEKIYSFHRKVMKIGFSTTKIPWILLAIATSMNFTFLRNVARKDGTTNISHFRIRLQIGWKRIPISINLQSYQKIIFLACAGLKFRFSEKATKTWKTLPLDLKLLSKRQNKWEIVSNFVASSTIS